MNIRFSNYSQYSRIGVLMAAIIGAATFAVYRTTASPVDRATAAPAAAQPVPTGASDLPADPHGGALPPNHPPIGGANSPRQGAISAAADEAPAIAWKGPDGWATAPNPNALRLATYKVEGPKGAEDAEATVSRAGGTIDANIERWLGQFDDAGKDTRTEKTVSGFKVTVVEVSGTYRGNAMMPTATAAPKTRWSFVGAIVQTPGSSYFFKLTGPAATVRASRARFDAMIDGIKPAT
jgi:hypothetical protein